MWCGHRYRHDDNVEDELVLEEFDSTFAEFNEMAVQFGQILPLYACLARMCMDMIL